mgnify:CR=1 FL=1
MRGPLDARALSQQISSLGRSLRAFTALHVHGACALSQQIRSLGPSLRASTALHLSGAHALT